MGNKIVIFFTLFLVWLLLTFNLTLQSIVVGVVVCGLISFSFKKSWTKNPYKFLQWRRFLWFLYFLGVFVWECIKANIDVAMRVLHPKMPIVPGILKLKTECKTEVSITFLSNFITLTPGTFTVDADLQNGFLYIHWINVRTKEPQEAYQLVVRRFERIIRKVFE